MKIRSHGVQACFMYPLTYFCYALKNRALSMYRHSHKVHAFFKMLGINPLHLTPAEHWQRCSWVQTLTKCTSLAYDLSKSLEINRLCAEQHYTVLHHYL